jgi:hypothetical protein
LTCRDGGIEGVLNHEASTLESARAADVYATDQPQAAFHARIAFCMDVHNEVGLGVGGVGTGLRSSLAGAVDGTLVWGRAAGTRISCGRPF